MGLYRLSAIILISFLCFSCGGSSGEEEVITPQVNTIDIELASYRRPCVGVSQQLCKVQIEINGDFSNFYSEIKGFDFEWGKSYKLRISNTAVPNPPADGSSIEYELQSILSVSEDAPGWLYQFDNVVLLTGTTFSITDDGSWFFIGQPFICSENLNCGNLLSLAQSGGIVNLKFVYLGEGVIALQSWN